MWQHFSLSISHFLVETVQMPLINCNTIELSAMYTSLCPMCRHVLLLYVFELLITLCMCTCVFRHTLIGNWSKKAVKFTNSNLVNAIWYIIFLECDASNVYFEQRPQCEIADKISQTDLLPINYIIHVAYWWLNEKQTVRIIQEITRNVCIGHGCPHFRFLPQKVRAITVIQDNLHI